MALILQIIVAQTVEKLEQKATSAEEMKNYEEAANIWRSFITLSITNFGNNSSVTTIIQTPKIRAINTDANVLQTNIAVPA
ncbi:MAG: hypothetical protein V7K89_27205 [Nostoc sp.]|uniref:hypothetical protein n=1 Tax=Nostoc sp. TaxID=1180 RepID=UPI002FF655C9